MLKMTTFLFLVLSFAAHAADFIPTPYSEEVFRQKLKEGPVVVMFHKQGCGSCATLIKNAGTVFEDGKYKKIAFLQVDFLTEPGASMAKKYGLKDWSTIALFKQGQENPVNALHPGPAHPDTLKKLFDPIL